MFLLCVSNNNKYNKSNKFYYYQYLILILFKLNLYHPQIPVHLYLIGFTYQQIINLTKLHPNLTWEVDQTVIENISGYISNIRVKVMQKLFKKCDLKYIIYLDSDILIKGRLDGLLDQIKEAEENTVIVSIRDQCEDERLYFNTGILAIKRGDHITKMLEYWNQFIESRKYKWYSDQIGLYNCYLTFWGKVNFLDLDNRYNDSPGVVGKRRMFRESSFIWHAQNEYNTLIWQQQFYKTYKLYCINNWIISFQKNLGIKLESELNSNSPSNVDHSPSLHTDV